MNPLPQESGISHAHAHPPYPPPVARSRDWWASGFVRTGAKSERKPPMKNNDENNVAFTLTIRALKSDVPVYVRLRRVLKSLLRTYDFRCEYYAVNTTDAQNATDATGNTTDVEKRSSVPTMRTSPEATNPQPGTPENESVPCPT